MDAEIHRQCSLYLESFTKGYGPTLSLYVGKLFFKIDCQSLKRKKQLCKLVDLYQNHATLMFLIWEGFQAFKLWKAYDEPNKHTLRCIKELFPYPKHDKDAWINNFMDLNILKTCEVKAVDEYKPTPIVRYLEQREAELKEAEQKEAEQKEAEQKEAEHSPEEGAEPSPSELAEEEKVQGRADSDDDPYQEQ